MLSWLTARLSEPSTWATIGAVAGVVGPVLLPAEWPLILKISGIVFAAPGFAMAEKGTIPPAK